MIMLNNYKNILEYYANTPVNMIDIQKYQYNAGTNFEFDINDTLIKNLDSFFLYWQIQFRFNSFFNWTLNLSSNNIFTSNGKNTNYTDVSFLFQDKNNLFTIDHLIITPYCVFILEAKNHKANNKYYSSFDKWVLLNENTTKNIDNPVLQVIKYKSVVETFMNYYNIQLPIYPKVVFKQHVNLDNITDNEKQFCIFSDNLLKFIETSKKENIYQPNEALKFAKILYYYGCHPIAYDDNKVKWSVSK